MLHASDTGMSFFALALILAIGFLHFVVVFMEVNPAALMATVIALMTAIVSTTISDILTEFRKTFCINGNPTSDEPLRSLENSTSTESTLISAN